MCDDKIPLIEQIEFAHRLTPHHQGHYAEVCTAIGASLVELAGRRGCDDYEPRIAKLEDLHAKELTNSSESPDSSIPFKVGDRVRVVHSESQADSSRVPIGAEYTVHRIVGEAIDVDAAGLGHLWHRSRFVKIDPPASAPEKPKDSESEDVKWAENLLNAELLKFHVDGNNASVLNADRLRETIRRFRAAAVELSLWQQIATDGDRRNQELVKDRDEKAAENSRLAAQLAVANAVAAYEKKMREQAETLWRAEIERLKQINSERKEPDNADL